MEFDINSNSIHSPTCDGGFAVMRQSYAGDWLAVMIRLRLSGRLVLKESPYGHAVLQHARIFTVIC